MAKIYVFTNKLSQNFAENAARDWVILMKSGKAVIYSSS